MKTNLLLKNLEISDKLQALMERKIEKLRKYYSNIQNVDLDLSRSLKQKSGLVYRTEINVTIPGHLLRAEEKGETIRAAFEMAYDKVHRQLTEEKNKNIARKTKKI